MVNINKNFLKLQDSYLFSTVNRKVKEYKEKYPSKRIINLGIGDVTKPLPKVVIEAMKKACDEMGETSTFKGYGPEQGYDFLRKKIVENDYIKRNIEISKDEVFVSDGSKCDVGNIVDLFENENIVAITDPVYPVYLDTNIIAGRGGKYDNVEQKYENIIYMPCIEENNFIPNIPKEIPDIIYLCYPNNPTGTVLEKDELEKWVKFAKENNSIILFDSAYEAYITDKNIPHSIYEVEGAKDVAIEFRSFSKTAGFTGVRCAYTIIPKELKRKIIYNDELKEVSLNKMWNRRHCTKFNGVSYITQRGAEAVYSIEAQNDIKKYIKYYLENAKMIKDKFQKWGYKVYGGENAPYIWIKTPKGKTSWEFFDEMIEKYGIVGTPGSGFGPSGEGYFRLTGFGKREDLENW